MPNWGETNGLPYLTRTQSTIFWVFLLQTNTNTWVINSRIDFARVTPGRQFLNRRGLFVFSPGLETVSGNEAFFIIIITHVCREMFIRMFYKEITQNNMGYYAIVYCLWVILCQIPKI